MSDWPSLDRGDRVLPGEGISLTRELVAALAAAGWDGALDVEIFSTPDLFWGCRSTKPPAAPMPPSPPCADGRAFVLRGIPTPDGITLSA